MYNIRLAGLDTGRKYYVKVRAKVVGYESSEWSIPFGFEAPKDTMAPAAVQFLRFVSEGDSFLANWAAPSVNADGSPCADISHYNLKIKNLDTNAIVTEKTVDPSYAIDINRNASLFGQLAGKIQITVSAVDLSGNEGIAVSAIAQNPAPAKVTNVTAAARMESIVISWSQGTETDLANYEVHVGSTAGFIPAPETLRARVAVGNDTFSYDTASLSVVFFKVIAVDKFGQKSIPSDVVSAQPKLTTDFDKTPPGAVSGFTVAQTLAQDSSHSVARLSFTALPDLDLDKYEVQYRKTGETVTPWSFTNVPSDLTTAEIKPLPLSTSFDFKIRAVDFNANKGAWSSVVVAAGVKKTALPAAPTAVTVKGGMSNLMITWTGSTDASMANFGGTYEVQISKASTFTTPTTIKTSSTLASFINLDQNVVYYARVRSLDPYGNIGGWSTTANGNTGLVADANASKITWGDTAPATGKTNDLWIKTPENVQYRYNGTTWVIAQDATILEGQGNKNFTADVAPTGTFKEGDTWMQTPEYIMHVYKSGAWTKAQDANIVGKITTAQQTADGKNKVWYQASKPPLTNNTTGDTWFDTDDGNKLNVWSSAANDWLPAQDAAIQEALNDASDAMTTADGKNKLFFTTPTGTLREGDTWFDGAIIKQYRNGAWVNASDTLDTAKAREALNVAGTKNKTYRMAKASAVGMIEGDILFDTADGNKQYRYAGTAWVLTQDTAIPAAAGAALTAQQTADKKNTIFYATPTGTLREGDTWFDGTAIKQYRSGAWVNASDTLDTAKAREALSVAGSKNKTYYTDKASATGMLAGDILFDTADGNKQYRYSGSAWVSAQDASIAAAASAAGAAQTTADKKNTIYYATPPAGAVLKDGDVWFDGAKIKTYRGTAWVDSSTGLTTQQAIDAAAVAAAKTKSYYTTYAARPTTGLTIGDLLFDTAAKYKPYRYNGTTWESIQDGTIADAQSAANAAKTAAELRAQTFYEATGPANTNSRLKVNDLWIRSSDNQLHRWSGSAWLEIQDDAIALTQSNLNTAVTNLQQSITNVEDYADGKVDSFISDIAPTTMVEGDIWFDTSISPIAVKVYRGTTWVVSGDKAALDAAAAVQVNLNATNTALNKKNTTYAQTAAPTTGLVIGDLWLNTTLVGGVAKNEMNRWDGAAWIKTQDKLIFDAQALADGKAMVFTKSTMPTDAESDLGDIWFDTSTTPWSVKVRTGTAIWTVSGDKTARDAAQTAQTEAARKIQSFYSDTDPAGTPANNVKAGDIWYTVATKRAQIRTASNTWQELKDTAIDAVTATANDLKNTVIPNLAGQVDNKIEVTIGATAPTITDAVKQKGDLWINPSTGLVKVYSGTGTTWNDVKDPAAMTAASNAATLAGTKRQVFGGTTEPSKTTNVLVSGDLWLNETTQRFWKYNGTAWIEFKDVAIATAQSAADAAAGQAATALGNAQTAFNLADGKANVFHQASPGPTGLVAADKGDIWVNTSKTPNEINAWSGTAWVVTGDPATKIIADAAQTLAGTKAYTYFGGTKPTTASTPKPTTGDIWINTAKTPHEVQVYNGTDFAIAADSDARTSAAEKAYIFTTTNSTAPTSPTPKRGDVWIDTSNGKTKIRSATAWVDTTDPEARTIANSKITTYYNGTAPTAPAGGFTTGDLWVRTTDNRLHRWSGSWVELKDADITAAKSAADAAAGQAATALGNAQTAFNLADGKAQVFFGGARPTNLVAADKGDIWVDTTKTPNEIQTWSGTTWAIAGDPATKTIADAANTLAGQKSYVYTQTTAPTAATVPAPTRGDTWIHSTTGETKIWSGSAWIVTTDPAAQAIANRKITTYYNGTAPTAPAYGFSAGDLWVKTPENRMNRWSGSAWVELKDADITAAKAAADAAQTTATTALTAANAHNRNIYSTGDATGTTLNGYAFISGDTWYKRDAANTIIGMWEFQGNAWVAKTLNNQVIANLDAAKITSGYINADRIDAGAITIGKIKAGDVATPAAVDQSIFNARTVNYGYLYKTSITIFGDHDKYYPVLVFGGDQNVDREIFIMRGYGELHPPEWNSASHGGGLNVLTTVNFGGWGGVLYKQRIDQLSEQYNPTFADLQRMPTGTGMFYFLRGGGTTGAKYTFYSDQKLEGPLYSMRFAENDVQLVSPQIFYDPVDYYLGASTLYKYKSPTPLTAPNTQRINEISYVDASKTAFQLTDKWKFPDQTTIDGGEIQTNTISANKVVVGGMDARVVITNGTVTANELAANSVIAGKILAGAVESDKIKANAINASHIISEGIDGTVVIKDGTLTATQIAGQTITGDKILGNTIDATHIKAGSITIGATSPIAPGTVATPTDVSGALATANTNIATAKGEAITAAGTAADSKVATALTTAANTAQAKADAAKTAAEAAAKQYADGQISATALATANAAATDAQTKANTAKSEAIAAAGTAADGKISTAVTPINTKIGGWSHPTNTTFIDGGKIFTDSITAGQIAANAITVNELAANAVTADKIKAGEINASKIVSTGLDGSVVITNGTITATQIAGKTITGAEIKAGTLDAGHIAAGSITIGAGKPIAAGTVALPSDVSTAKTEAINAAGTAADSKVATALTTAANTAQTKADAAALAAKNAAQDYADGKITTAQAEAISTAATEAAALATAARTAAENAAKGYTDTTIAPINTSIGTINTNLGTINSDLTVVNSWKKTGFTTIDGGKIATDSITSAQIEADAIQARHIDGQQITTEHIAVKGLIGSTVIADGTITTLNLNAKAVTADKIATNTILVGNIAPDAIDNTVIKDGAITTLKIKAGEVKTGNLDAGAVTADKVAANSISAQKLIVGRAENMVNDPNFVEAMVAGKNWLPVTGMSIVAEGANGTNALKIVGTAVQQATYNQPQDSVMVEANAQIRVTVSVKSSAAIVANSIGVGFQLKSATGVVTWPAVVYVPAQAAITAYKTVDLGIFKVPTDGTLSWYIVSQTNSGTGTVWFNSLSVMRAVGSTTIADNAITTGKIEAGAITALKIAAGQITIGGTTGHIATGAIANSGEVVPKISGPVGNRVFRDLAGFSQSLNAATGALIVRTPITFNNYMTTIKLSGYNYQGSFSSIDVTVTFYAYSTPEGGTVAQAAYNSSGLLPVEVAICKTNAATPTIGLIIKSKSANGLWYYPKLIVDEAAIGQSSAPDAFKSGWSIEHIATPDTNAELMAWTKTIPTGDGALNQATTVRIADGWKATGKTTINGGVIEADSIKVGSIESGKLTIGHMAPGQVATPSQLTAAEQKAASDLAAAQTTLLADATSKANAAKLAAEAAAKSYADGQITDVEARAAAEAAEIAETERVEAVRLAGLATANAVQPINQTLDNWGADGGRTYINGGNIKTGTITANQIAAGSIVIGAQNSPLSSTGIVTDSKLATEKTTILNSAASTADSKVSTALVPINSSIGTINTNVTNVTTTANNTATTLSGLTTQQLGVTVIDGGKIKTDSVTALQIAAEAITASEIKAGEITGTKLATDLAVVNNLKVQSSIDINHVNGHIKSSNYNANGTAGFYMDQQQLIINQGKIKAATLELQDSANLMPAAYAAFGFNVGFYGATNFWHSGVTAANKIATAGFFGGSRLNVTSTLTTAYIIMARLNEYNIATTDTTGQYIISFYANNASGKTVRVQPYLYNAAGSSNVPTAITLQAAAGWVRYSTVVNSPVPTNASLRFNLLDTAMNISLDGIQVEKKQGALDTPSNWTPPGFTSIDGESITTGAISSNITATVGNESQPMWSINTAGNAKFMDAVVTGKLIVGGYGQAENAKNEKVSIQSDSYSPGMAGWAIKGNGDVEFNNGTFRGALNLTKANLTMTAAVSEVDVYSSATDFTPIDVANIRGTTYSYNRALVAGTEDTHRPTTPRPDRKGEFFIGPTTDRSVNIQVHDGSSSDAVYLGDAPNNVSITALNIGEQTQPSSPPAVREDQGLSFRAKRIESRGYTYTGGNAQDENVSVVDSSIMSTVKLRSPLYPESDDDLDMYPLSSHRLTTSTDYTVPKKKNLLPSGQAVGWTFVSTIYESAQAASLSWDLSASIVSGEGRMASVAVSPFANGRYVRVAPFSPIAYASSKRHIVSFYVNTLEAESDTYIGVKTGSQVFTPLNPATGTLPSMPNLYSTVPSPGDHWDLAAGWTNRGANQKLTAINQFSGGTPAFVNGAPNILAAQRVRASCLVADHFLNGGTVSFWFKPANSGNAGDANMYHRGVSTSVNKEMWVIYNGTTEKLTGGIALSGTARTWVSTNQVKRGEWNHVAVVIGPSTTNRIFRVYLNGVLDVDTTFTSILGGFDTGQYIHIGADRNLTQQFTGQIGDVAHWESTLTSTQVTEIHSVPRSSWPVDAYSVGQTVAVPAGQKAHRVSFWSDTLTGTSTPAISLMSAYPRRVGLFAFQLEEAAYKDDVNLSTELRNSKRPTAWSVSNLDVRSAASVSVESKPVVNFLDYIESTKALLPAQRSGLNIDPPAQIKFNVGSRFSDDYATTEQVFSGDMFTSEATYKMSAKGLSYPGSRQPFMPTAMDIQYNFLGMTSTSRPRIGGSGFYELPLNDVNLGSIKMASSGLVLKDNFDYPNQDVLPAPWQIDGARTARVLSNRAYLPYNTQTVDGEFYVYHGDEFSSQDQVVSCTVEGTTGIGWRYGYGGPMISINPIRGDRLHLVVLNNADPIWRLIAFKGNVKTTLASGSFTGTRTGIPVIKLSRSGNTITGHYNSTQLFKTTFAPEQLPQGGRFTGFAANVGHIDNFTAALVGDDVAANGLVMPYSININNGRGLRVFTGYEVIDSSVYYPGDIYILAPGYYSITATVFGATFGGAQADNFWIDAIDRLQHLGKADRVIQLGGMANKSNGDSKFITGSATAYLEGQLIFRLLTDDTSVNRVDRIELSVVRVA